MIQGGLKLSQWVARTAASSMQAVRPPNVPSRTATLEQARKLYGALEADSLRQQSLRHVDAM